MVNEVIYVYRLCSGVTRWISPGAATEVVTPFFLKKKLVTFFSHHRLPVLRWHVTPNYFLLKNLRPFFAHHYHFY